MTMQEHLINAGYNLVTADDRIVIVQDPRWLNYRVYSATENPDDYVNAHIDAPKQIFDTVDEALTA